MRFGLYWRLAIMMFLQYMIWGAWFPVLSVYLGDAGFSGQIIGLMYCLLPLGTLLSPVTGGQLADRFIPAQWLLVIANLGSAVLLYFAYTIDYTAMEQTTAIWTLTGLMLGYSLLYGPTIPLTNALSFRHLDNIERDFGKIRVWGTLGWIAAGLLLSAWRSASVETAAAGETSTLWFVKMWDAIWKPTSAVLGGGMIPFLGNAGPRDFFLLGAVCALLLGVFSVILPHTPPKREGVDPLAFMKSFRMLRERNFLTFMVISFVVITELYFYYILTGPFLESEKLGVASKNVPGLLTTAQIGEIFTMIILLPLLLPRLGVRFCLILGVLAWPIRYAVFVIGSPTWLVVASLPLHGFCYVFFFVVGQIYVDNESPPDIRASAQSLWAVVVLGVGSIVGSYFAGWVRDLFTVDGVVDYQKVFMVPLVATILCAIAFFIFFKEPEKKAAQQPVDAGGGEG